MSLVPKPFVTILGDESISEQIISNCIRNLRMEPTKWFRKRGSGFKLVHVDIDAKKFDTLLLSSYDMVDQGYLLLHIFVIVENEEVYNHSAKYLFNDWIGFLRSRLQENWKVIIVPDDNPKSKNKFTINKFVLSNKLKNDFNIPKLDNQSIRLNENPRERLGQIQNFLRETILRTYDDICYKIEDKIRIQRESRYTPIWNYFDYFILQEELADIYECLNLYEESLAQFDESDAVFSKCLEDFHKDEDANWIHCLREVPFEKIDCLTLTTYSDPKKKWDLLQGKLCLEDFRAYLLSRQCGLLQFLNRDKDIPGLVYITLLKFLNECRLLKIEIDSNLRHCWIFLTVQQVLQKFKFNDCDDLLAQDYAALFLLSLNSINKLASSFKIWMPSTADWTCVEDLREKLNILSEDEYGDTPSSRLAGGFKSQADFQNFHCKQFEEGLMIWKHIRRIRSANLLGMQLADLYYKAEQYDKAEPLYIKAIKCLRNENWAHLAMPLRLKLAFCQKDKFDNDPEKYLKTCVHLAGATFLYNKRSFNPDLPLTNVSDHQFYYTELKKCVTNLFTKTHQPQQFKLTPLFTIDNINLSPPGVDGFQVLHIVLDSHLAQSTDVKLTICGIKYPELDLTESNENQLNNNAHDINNDIDECPALYSIPLTSVSSPKLHRIGEPNARFKNVRDNFHCQSSIDEEILNINNGVMVEFNDIENCDEESNDKIFSLVCFPKTDAGLEARRTSMSMDIGISLTAPLQSHHSLMNLNEKTTIFKLMGGKTQLTINPGRNEFKLVSQEYGLYIPKCVEILLFDDQALVKDDISSHMLDDDWSDRNIIQAFLPKIVIDDDLDNFGFIYFINQINPKIKIGQLAFPAEEIFLTLNVNKDSYFSRQTVNRKSDKESKILKPGELISLNSYLDYNLQSIKDKVFFTIPTLIKVPFEIPFFENVFLSKDIIPTSGSKYIISIGFQRPLDRQISRCDYQIKNASLKLHHQDDIRQFLPLAHRCLSAGAFNDYSYFTILWTLESRDIVGFERDRLQFTLSMDLTLNVKNRKQLIGNMVHDFELRSD